MQQANQGFGGTRLLPEGGYEGESRSGVGELSRHEQSEEDRLSGRASRAVKSTRKGEKRAQFVRRAKA
ncbi:hypothetical protein NDU88_006234 [Pleurodeles waltl]|uniref:Uncharacterized protein n=1 Tax=Pleurodeles waltl TaxID=8319 RepID=A0AAV7LZN5_PLEWA|nr:hypothetical protein NDU88_006234 [Pleurodeles waltl]